MDGRSMERVRAIERYRAGESVESICVSLKRSRSWFYKWLTRADGVDGPWFEERSRRPLDNHVYQAELRTLILETRRRLEIEGNFSGAQMIAWELEDLGIQTPSLATIKRILKSAGATARLRRRPSRGKRYPAPMALSPSAVHQIDFVGPRHVNQVRFYSLNAVDVATARSAALPLRSRATDNVIPALWTIWCRLGIPTTLQVDNELIFFGNRAYPRATGQIIRLCTTNDVELFFIPIREPWRNGVVEKFNDHWDKKLYQRVWVESFSALCSEALAFEQRHNATWKYSKLDGRTPNHALRDSKAILRFPPSPEPPRRPLPKPDHGRVHFVRFIRSDGQLEIFGQHFRLPSEATHEYVQATVDIAASRLTVTLDGNTIEQIPYRVS